jgi:cytidylate kinase
MTDSGTFALCVAYIQNHAASRPASHPGATHARPARAPTLTLSRLTGAGGLPIAERLAALLQERRPGTPAAWTVFHRTLVEKVLADHNLPAELAKYMAEDRVSYIQDTTEELLGLHPSRTDLVARVTETILGLAELGNCIIVGRAANVILAKTPSVFHVRLVSDLACRVSRVMKDKGMTEAEATEFIRHEDSARENYLRAHFDADINDPLAYHLTINTDWVTIEDAAELIAQAVLRRFPANPS